MLLIPRGRDPTAKQIATIEETMRVVFGFDHDVNERPTHTRFIASCAQSFAQAAGLFANLFDKRLTAEERREWSESWRRPRGSTDRPRFRPRRSIASSGWSASPMPGDSAPRNDLILSCWQWRLASVQVINALGLGNVGKCAVEFAHTIEDDAAVDIGI